MSAMSTTFDTLSLHDALPISQERQPIGFWRQREAFFFQLVKYEGIDRIADALGMCHGGGRRRLRRTKGPKLSIGGMQDRKSTRLNSSHPSISSAVFCLKKKNP